MRRPMDGHGGGRTVPAASVKTEPPIWRQNHTWKWSSNFQIGGDEARDKPTLISSKWMGGRRLRLQFDLRDSPPLFRSLPSMPVVARSSRHFTVTKMTLQIEEDSIPEQAAMTSANQTNFKDPTLINGSAHKIKLKEEWIAVPT